MKCNTILGNSIGFSGIGFSRDSIEFYGIQGVSLVYWYPSVIYVSPPALPELLKGGEQGYRNQRLNPSQESDRGEGYSEEY